ncbi:MAG: c-type cytochrome domain-containing protein, partial [Verrucomicrobiota bacterium]
MYRLILPFILSIPFVSAAAEDATAIKFFETEIRPLLAGSCYSCHGPEKDKGSLRLDHISHIRKGGDTGSAIVDGKPEESLLIEVVRREDPDFAMPPKDADALSEKQVAALEKWIAMGAPWPEEVVEGGPVDENGFTEEDRNWWAIQPVVDPALPYVGGGWARNEIDRFV